MKAYKCLFLLLSVFVALSAGAQNLTVKGTITDGSNGDPIPFATVVVKGLTTWTTTDAEGRYSIEAPSNGTLSVACLGYEDAEILVGARSLIDIVLNPDVDALSEAVVIGYGVQQKKLLTGSTIQVKGDELAKLNTTSALGALQSQSPGVSITQNSGQPGRGYGMATVNPYVWEQWDKDEPGDIRKQASIYFIEEEMEDPSKYTWGNDQQMEETGYWQKKYQAYGAIVNGKFFYEFSSVPEYGGAGSDLGRGHSLQNVQIIRFADVLLMHSELTDGKVIYNGKSGMNAVRNRAGLPDKAYSVAALETQLGQPIRNNSAQTVMKDQNTGYRARYEATWGFRPFPQSEISLSNGVLKQNPGWTDASAQYTSWK